jgi:hypothetical protein
MSAAETPSAIHKLARDERLEARLDLPADVAQTVSHIPIVPLLDKSGDGGSNDDDKPRDALRDLVAVAVAGDLGHDVADLLAEDLIVPGGAHDPEDALERVSGLGVAWLEAEWDALHRYLATTLTAGVPGAPATIRANACATVLSVVPSTWNVALGK